MDFFFAPHTLEALREGRFYFAYGPPPLLVAVLMAALVAVAWLLYRRTTRSLSAGWKGLLIGLRSITLVLLLLILMRPVVTTSQVSPQETWLAVVIDDSASMTVPDAGGRDRLTAVREALYGQEGIIAPLAELFQVRLFAFDRDTRRLQDAGGLTGSGNTSDIGQALAQVDSRLGGLPLAGLVLISDGADNSGEAAAAAARQLGEREVPVFTVGVGADQLPSDVSIVDVQSDSTILDDSRFTVQVELWQRGYAGQAVEMRILDGEEVVARQTVPLDADGTTRRYEFTLEPTRRDSIVYQVEVDEMGGELIVQNNRHEFLVDNSGRPPLNVLYVEGHPRNEYKFIRRAATHDDNLRLASYLQTGPGRIYRQGLDNPQELANGFPTDRETLYAYEGLIIGDVSRDFFSSDQLEMINDFVAERGGGLLVSGMLEDTWEGTPVADMLPLSLIRGDALPDYLQGGIRRGGHATGDLFAPARTLEGELSGMLRLADSESENRARWDALPELQGIYVTGRPRPGATVLLEHPVLAYQGQQLPVLATQRYGSGRTLFLTTASTWRWQMLMESSDDSHERLWRQMLRWLAVSAPRRVEVAFDEAYYHAGDSVTVSATIRDDSFQPDNEASVWLQLTDPAGGVRDVQMEWDIDEDGVYRSRFTASQEGVYRVLVDSTSTAGPGLEQETRASFVVTPSRREFTDAAQDRPLLERLAASAGGGYYDISESDRLLEDIEYTPNAHSEMVQEDLWDQPFMLLLLIALLSSDWALRRHKGLS